MTGGSQQQRLYRRARRDGATVASACVASGIAMSEARLIEAEDLRSPPPPEAFELLSITTPPEPGTPEEEAVMARPKKQQAESAEQVHQPDFDLAVRIYRNDIKPAQTKVGEYAQEQSTAYKAIKKQAHIQPAAAKLAFKLDEMEESHRDDFLRGLNGLLRKLNIFMPVDMVDMAEGKGKAGASVVPIGGERAKPQLATLPTPPADDSDLAAAAPEPVAAE